MPEAAEVPARAPKPHDLIRPRTRLTGDLIEEMAGLAAMGTPLADIADYVNVPIKTMTEWRRRGRQAAELPRSRTSQLDRLCITFDSRMRLGGGQAAVRNHLAVAKAAGLTREEMRVKDIRTTTVTNHQGETTTTRVEVDRQIPYDWRAAAHIGRYRFPATQSDEPEPEEPETPTGPAINPGQLYERLIEIRDSRTAHAIDTTAIELPPAPPNGRNGAHP